MPQCNSYQSPGSGVHVTRASTGLSTVAFTSFGAVGADIQKRKILKLNSDDIATVFYASTYLLQLFVGPKGFQRLVLLHVA